MFESFMSWEMLATYATFLTVVFMVVEFTKELPIVSKIRTKYYSAMVAFMLIILVNLHAGTFKLWDIVLYILSGISISFASNGLADFNKKVTKDKDVKENRIKTIEYK